MIVWVASLVLPAAVLGHLVGYNLSHQNPNNKSKNKYVRTGVGLIFTVVSFGISGEIKSGFSIPDAWKWLGIVLFIFLFIAFLIITLRRYRGASA